MWVRFATLSYIARIGFCSFFRFKWNFLAQLLAFDFFPWVWTVDVLSLLAYVNEILQTMSLFPVSIPFSNKPIDVRVRMDAPFFSFLLQQKMKDDWRMAKLFPF